MHWLDTTIVAVLLIGAVLGFLTGFLWQVARIAGLVLSAYCSATLHEPSCQLVRDVFKDGDARIVSAAAYVLVFVLVYLGLYVCAMALKAAIRAADLENLDRLAGAVLGLAKSALLAGAVCLLLQYWSHPMTRDWMAQTKIAPAMAQAMEQGIALVPHEYKQSVLEGFSDLRERLAKSPPAKKSDDIDEAPERSPKAGS